MRGAAVFWACRAEIRTLLTIRWRSAKARAGEFLITLRSPRRMGLALPRWCRPAKPALQFKGKVESRLLVWIRPAEREPTARSVEVERREKVDRQRRHEPRGRSLIFSVKAICRRTGVTEMLTLIMSPISPAPCSRGADNAFGGDRAVRCHHSRDSAAIGPNVDNWAVLYDTGADRRAADAYPITTDSGVALPSLGDQTAPSSPSVKIRGERSRASAGSITRLGMPYAFCRATPSINTSRFPAMPRQAADDLSWHRPDERRRLRG